MPEQKTRFCSICEQLFVSVSLYPIYMCHFIPSLSMPPTWNPIPSESTQSVPKTNLSTNNQLEHQRPTRAVTTNWAESSEVSCVPPLMVGPLQRNALHAHCTPLSPSICDKQNYICSPFSRCTKLKRALFVKFLSLKSNTQGDGNRGESLIQMAKMSTIGMWMKLLPTEISIA